MIYVTLCNTFVNAKAYSPEIAAKYARWNKQKSCSPAIQITGGHENKFRSKDIAMRKSKWNCELSLQQLLSDPLVNTLMAADRVDVDELQVTLSEAARKRPRAKTSTRKGIFAFAECRC